MNLTGRRRACASGLVRHDLSHTGLGPGFHLLPFACIAKRVWRTIAVVVVHIQLEHGIPHTQLLVATNADGAKDPPAGASAGLWCAITVDRRERGYSGGRVRRIRAERRDSQVPVRAGGAASTDQCLMHGGGIAAASKLAPAIDSARLLHLGSRGGSLRASAPLGVGRSLPVHSQLAITEVTGRVEQTEMCEPLCLLRPAQIAS
jgi:hypothetical protein